MRQTMLAALAIAVCSFSAPRQLESQQPTRANPVSVLEALQRAGSSAAPTATAHAGAYSFADLRWGATKAETKAKLARAGLHFLKQDKEGDLAFSGSVLGQRTVIDAQFAGNRLARVLVFLATDADDARPVYDEMRAALIQKYSAPRATVEQFSEPYAAGDGHEVDALRAGKATIVTFWVNEVAGREERLTLGIASDLSVGVSYQSPEWPAEEKARAAKATKVF